MRLIRQRAGLSVFACRLDIIWKNHLNNKQRTEFSGTRTRVCYAECVSSKQEVSSGLIRPAVSNRTEHSCVTGYISSVTVDAYRSWSDSVDAYRPRSDSV